MDNNIKIFISVVAILILGVIGAVIFRSNNQSPAQSGQYNEFAQCLKDQGAIFYGAFWCPNCQAQKKLFGSSAKLVPYVECSTADGRTQTQTCIKKEISGYPTWEFADGSRLTGETPLETLAEKTGCELPAGEGAPVSENTGVSSDASVPPVE